MDDECPTPTLASYGGHKVLQVALGVLVVNSDATLDSDGNGDCRTHGGDALGHELGRCHQTRAERALLNAVGRATHVEIDLVVAPAGADASRLCQLRRIAATKLQSHWVLGRGKVEE